MAEDTKELSQPQAESPHSMAAVLERFDLADDSKIIKALTNRVTQGFTYKVNGKFGLSSAGTLWAVREFAKQGEVYRVMGLPSISICPLDPDYVNISLMVQRFFVNPATGQEIPLDTTIGHKRMCRKAKRFKDDQSDEFEFVEDPEFVTKAITKAERNGKQKLMPKDSVTALIAKATGQTASPAPAKSTAKPAGPAKPAGAPAEAAKPATSAPATSAPAATGPAKPAGAAPPAEAAKPATPATQPAPSAAAPASTAPAAAPAAAPPAEPAGKPKMTKEVMVQKLDAVCKLVFQTQDGALARQRLCAITGKASPSDLSEEEIKTVGNAINAVAKKTAVIEGNNIVKIADKSIMWKGPELPPPQESPAEGGAEGDMF
jgi:hypothetical protein